MKVSMVTSFKAYVSFGTGLLIFVTDNHITNNFVYKYYFNNKTVIIHSLFQFSNIFPYMVK